MRSIQNTNLCIGLLTAPVKIFPASSSDAEVQLSTCGPEGEEVSRVYIAKDEEPIRVIDYDDLAKSYSGRLINPTDLANIEESCLTDEQGNDLKEIHIDSFMPLKDLPRERITGLYYIGPNMEVSSKSFETLKAAMKKKKVAAIAKIVLRSRQKLLALYVQDDVMHAVVLSFAAQVNLREDVELIPEDVKVRKEEVDMAMTLIDTSMNPLAVNVMEDTFVARKRTLVEAAVNGKEVKVVKPKVDAADSLMDALKASVKVKNSRKGKVR